MLFCQSTCPSSHLSACLSTYIHKNIIRLTFHSSPVSFMSAIYFCSDDDYLSKNMKFDYFITFIFLHIKHFFNIKLCMQVPYLYLKRSLKFTWLLPTILINSYVHVITLIKLSLQNIIWIL